jgi:hypothetical protein
MGFFGKNTEYRTQEIEARIREPPAAGLSCGSLGTYGVNYRSGRQGEKCKV